MKLIMALSMDCFVCKKDEWDDMSWTGPANKFLFKCLTLTGPRILFAGRKTAERMPDLLGRSVIGISQKDESLFSLQEAQAFAPTGWLIGGLTIAMAALEAKLITEVVIVQNQHQLHDGVSGSPLIEFVNNEKHDWIYTEAKHANLRVWNYQNVYAPVTSR